MRIRITASGPAVTGAVAADITADVGGRTLVGTLYRYGEVGQTSAGPLAVGPSMPPPPLGLPITAEHDRGVVRAAVAMVDNNTERVRIGARVVDGILGDQALSEALPPLRSRAAFSLDIEDAEVVDGVIVSGRWEAIGQVENPAFNSARIDQIAASNNPGVPMLTEAQRARLVELLAIQSRDAAQESELQSLLTAGGLAAPVVEPDDDPAAVEPAAAAETAAVAASMPSVPAGVPSAAQARTTPRAELQRVIRDLTAALQPGVRSAQAVTAALSDIIHSDHTGDIEPLAWSGELWSGLVYEPQFTDLFTSGPLTYWQGTGWRFTSAPEMQDYAGDKAAIPTGTVGTEDSAYTAARMAVGVDIDRKFFDFPNEAFVSGLLQKIRESWEVKLDAKVKDYALAQAVPATRGVSVTKTSEDATITFAAGALTATDVGATVTGTGIPANTTLLSWTDATHAELSANATSSGTITATVGQQESSLLKAAARAALTLKRRRVGRASFIVVNDEDLFSLTDVVADQVPAFLDLYGIDPRNFRSSADVPQGKVLAGAKQAATLRTLPGSPIRVEAQNLANGGIDEAFFGYWAIEEHHTSGIVTVGVHPAA